ncbi:MAG: single-stranded DNA-binding protein [Candidatus Altiarchaeota archaeon]|nr:single-stranded DNA-binding protein [Candidatus Altiarchaeota archaeon]
MGTVEELSPRARGVELTVNIVEKGEEREVTAKATGKQHRVAEFLVGDATGSILLSLWDDAIDSIEVGATYIVKNGYVSTFRNSMRLNTGRYGTIELTEEKVEANTENNVSDKFVEDQRRF